MGPEIAATICTAIVGTSLPLTVALIKWLPNRNGNGKKPNGNCKPVKVSCADVADCELKVDVAQLRTEQSHVGQGLQEVKTQLADFDGRISESLRRIHERIDQQGG